MFTRGSLFCVSGLGVGVPVRKVGIVVSDISVVSFGFSDVELVVASVVIGIRTRSSVFCVTAIRPLISNYVNSRIMNVQNRHTIYIPRIGLRTLSEDSVWFLGSLAKLMTVLTEATEASLASLASNIQGGRSGAF